MRHGGATGSPPRPRRCGPDGRARPAGAAVGGVRARSPRVLLAGGPRLAGSFLRAGLIDRLAFYVAPALLGAGPPALADAGVSTISQAHRLDVLDVARVGDDVRLTCRLRPAPEAPLR